MSVTYVPAKNIPSLPLPLSNDFAVGLGFKQSEHSAINERVSAFTEEERYHYVASLLDRLREEHDAQQSIIYNRFTALYLIPLLDHWRRDQDAGSIYFLILNAIQDDTYFQTWLFFNPGEDLKLLKDLAEKMAATQWNDSLRITDIFHLCQMLATIMVYVDSDDALPEPLVTTLVGKTAEWHQLCQNAGFDVDPLDLHNPRNAIERAEKLLRRDPSWVADGRRVKVHIEQKMRRCNFPLCPVPHVEGTQNLKQCSRCKAARYCSDQHSRAYWKTHKEYCHTPAWL